MAETRFKGWRLAWPAMACAIGTAVFSLSPDDWLLVRLGGVFVAVICAAVFFVELERIREGEEEGKRR